MIKLLKDRDVEEVVGAGFVANNSVFLCLPNDKRCDGPPSEKYDDPGDNGVVYLKEDKSDDKK